LINPDLGGGGNPDRGWGRYYLRLREKKIWDEDLTWAYPGGRDVGA